MRKLAFISVVCCSLAAGYAIWPLVTAFQIRQAVKAGDGVTLARKVEWPRVRERLKSSLNEIQGGAREERLKRGLPAPSLWSRVKSSMVPFFADGMIDRYVNPESIANLDALKAMWRQSSVGAARIAAGDMAGAFTELTTEPTGHPLSRFAAFFSRIQSARFDGLDHVEFEIADKYVPERRYLSRFEFRNLEWKLVSVRVLGAGF